ncbi:amidohydrolase family protein [Chitinophaga alhagiae]|uniref:amidohydrolase family protein n=1 Tax=Chitinophaga alhagiae TaxID=2203219 RepID=UPI000E5A451D|nr:amidohydrolase family protein [Chitinophaga alhagiae]
MFNTPSTDIVKKNITDTHIHIWDLEKARYQWLEGDASILNRTYRLEELLPEMEGTPVTSGILVQAANHVKDTELMLEAARAHPCMAGVVGWLPLTDPAETGRLLESRFLREPYFKGVRHLIHNEADPAWLLQDTVLESLGILAAHHIPYDVVGVNDQHLQAAIRVSEKIPALRLVLDHLNQPPIKGQQRFGAWGTLMREIAGNGNVYAKISGLGTASGNPAAWTADDVAPYIGYALNVFGADRCLLGGDWPVSKLAGSYARHWEIYTGVINDRLNGADAEKVFHGNAARFYNI